MKKIKKLLKILLIIVVSFVILLYGGVFLGHKVLFPIKTSDVPTIEAVTDGTFTFGVQAHTPLPTEMEDYIKVLAGQIRRYNEVAPTLWPDNTLVNIMNCVPVYTAPTPTKSKTQMTLTAR